MPYALITALIFALVAILHGWRIFKGWTVQIGPYSVSMTVSWVIESTARYLGIEVDDALTIAEQVDTRLL